MRFPPIPGGPMSSSCEPVTDFLHLVDPPLQSSTCTQVPVSPKCSPVRGSFPPSACLHHPHVRSPPLWPIPAAQSSAGTEWLALCYFVHFPLCILLALPMFLPSLDVFWILISPFGCPFALGKEAWPPPPHLTYFPRPHTRTNCPFHHSSGFPDNPPFALVPLP